MRSSAGAPTELSNCPSANWTTEQKIRIIDGPFRDIEAIFDRYLSGSERVAILLDAIGASTIRVVLPSSCLAL